MKLYEFKTTRAYKCRWLINELGIDCEFNEVNLMEGEHRQEDFLKINPCGKVPALVDGDFNLFEASAICIYLADKHPEKGLIPKPATPSRAIFDKWLFFMSNELECHLWAMEKNTWGYPEDKRSADAIEMAGKDFIDALSIIDAEMTDKEYLVDNKFSVADISLGYLLRWAKGRKLIQDFPKLCQYLDTLTERDHYPREIFQ
jgi:glutathione S-transferase